MLAHAQTAAPDTAARRPIFASFGLGPAAESDIGSMLSATLRLTAGLPNDRNLTLRYSEATTLCFDCPEESAREMAVTYGLRAHRPYGGATVGIGLGLMQTTRYNRGSRTGLGIPVDAHAWLAPLPGVALGVAAMADASSAGVMTGAHLLLSIGRVRGREASGVDGGRLPAIEPDSARPIFVAAGLGPSTVGGDAGLLSGGARVIAAFPHRIVAGARVVASSAAERATFCGREEYAEAGLLYGMRRGTTTAATFASGLAWVRRHETVAAGSGCFSQERTSLGVPIDVQITRVLTPNVGLFVAGLSDVSPVGGFIAAHAGVAIGRLRARAR